MPPDQIFAKYNGKQVLNQYGAQCEAWAEKYAQELGRPIPTANAKDHTGQIGGYTWCPVPVTVQDGDIVVWGTDVGQYGHIAVGLDGSASSFRSYDQNWPLQETASGYGTGSVHLQPHNYYGVLGVQRPQLGDDMSQADKDALARNGVDAARRDQVERLILPSDQFPSNTDPSYGVGGYVVDVVDALSQNPNRYEVLYPQLQQQLNEAQKALADASQRPPEPAQGTITSTSTLQAVASFLKRLFNNA